MKVIFDTEAGDTPETLHRVLKRDDAFRALYAVYQKLHYRKKYAPDDALTPEGAYEQFWAIMQEYGLDPVED